MESALEVFISVFRATNAALVNVVDGNTNLKNYVQLGGYLPQERNKPRSRYAFEPVEPVDY